MFQSKKVKETEKKIWMYIVILLPSF
jgi:hypothetical protein